MTNAVGRAGFDLDVSSVAVVGASESSFWTRSLIINLRHYGFPGHIYAVNRRPGEVLGLPVYLSLSDLPEVPELCVVAVGSQHAVAIADQAGELGCRRLIMMSDGFADSGTDEGRARQADLRRVCQRWGMALVGPNCVGVADFYASVAAIGEPIPLDVTAGSVSVIAHSGGVLASLMAGLVLEGIGLDQCITLGNTAGIGLEDVFEQFLERDTTQVICGYLENLGPDPRALLALFDRLRAAGKRVILIKAGRGEVSQRISLSHTAQAAGADVLVDAAMRRVGVLRCTDVVELSRLARLLISPLAFDAGAGVAFIGSSGGAAGVAADLADQLGVRLARFTDATTHRLNELVPAEGYVGNPLDLSGRSGGAAVDTDAIFSAVLTDAGVAAPVYLFSAILPTDSPDRTAHRSQLEQFRGVAERLRHPVIVATLGRQRLTPWIEEFTRSSPWLIFCDGLEVSLRALAHVIPADPARPEATDADPLVRADQDPGVLSEADGRDLVAAAGFPCVPGRRCATVEDAVAAYTELGGPVVVKSIIPGVAHKAALGGVIRGVASASEVRERFGELASVADARALPFQGVMIESTASGTELLVGLERDPLFGEFVTLGLGGEHAERPGFKATRVLPLESVDEVHGMYRDAGLAELLGPDPRWLPALAEAVVRLAEVLVSRPDLATVELNPVFVADDAVLPQAADVLIVRSRLVAE
jgi:acetate---CoA ligase (ADP-forming)